MLLLLASNLFVIFEHENGAIIARSTPIYSSIERALELLDYNFYLTIGFLIYFSGYSLDFQTRSHAHPLTFYFT